MTYRVVLLLIIFIPNKLPIPYWEQFSLIPLLLTVRNFRRPKNFLDTVIIMYLGYILLRQVSFLVFSDAELDDFTELKRVVIFGVLAFSRYRNVGLVYKYKGIVLLFSALVVLLHLSSIPLYSHKIRMSGFLHGVNYSWTSAWFLMFVTRGSKTYEKYGILMSVLFLLLSASFTSIFIYVVFIALIYRKKLYSMWWMIILGIGAIPYLSYLLPERFIFISRKISSVADIFETRSLLAIPSFENRIHKWDQTWVLIKENI